MIGVVITVYNSADVILDCVESLFGQPAPVRIVLVENAAPTTASHGCKPGRPRSGSGCARSPPPRRRRSQASRSRR